MGEMKSWVDTCLVADNIWLVLVFHGVDGIGWEPRTGAELEEYFNYIQAREDQLWVATFADVTKYIRKRKDASVESHFKNDQISVSVSHPLDPSVYDVPLTFKTYVPNDWTQVNLGLGGPGDQILEVGQDPEGRFVMYEIDADRSTITLSAAGS